MPSEAEEINLNDYVATLLSRSLEAADTKDWESGEKLLALAVRAQEANAQLMETIIGQLQRFSRFAEAEEAKISRQPSSTFKRKRTAADAKSL
jgi:hypothetical protein